MHRFVRHEDLEPNGLAIVTGASSGLGLEIARQLGTWGFELLLVAEDPGIDFVARSLRAGGVEADAVQLDLTTSRGVEDLYAAVVERGEEVELLVLSGGAGGNGQFLRTALETEIDIIRLNCISVVHLAKRLLPTMVCAGAGQVLITTPPLSEAAGPRDAVYAGTRAFLQSFAESLRDELRDTGIAVATLRHPAEEAALDPADIARGAVEDFLAARARYAM